MPLLQTRSARFLGIELSAQLVSWENSYRTFTCAAYARIVLPDIRILGTPSSPNKTAGQGRFSGVLGIWDFGEREGAHTQILLRKSSGSRDHQSSRTTYPTHRVRT